MGRYQHVQRGWFGPALFLVGLGLTLLGTLVTWEAEPGLMFVIVGVVLELVGLSFLWLRVRDLGDELEIAFGVIPLARRRVPYGSIRAFAPGRTSWLDGWGIHAMPGRGWVWNIHGYDCVELETDRGRLRVGTDDQAGLLAHLAARVPHAAPDARGA